MGRVVAGRFELIDEIGAGGAAVVWRAYDHSDQRFCAAKLIEQQDPQELIRVVREQGVRLRHPHVVSPYAWAATDGVVVIASELVRGGSLATLTSDYGALPWRLIAEIGDQLLDALSAVHAAGIVHRDVKPANVLLDAAAAPVVRLSDFGIVHLVDAPRVTRTGFVVGTPGYLAPEMLRYGQAPHPLQDSFAAGVVLWQLSTGAEATGSYPRPADLPDPLWTVISGLLEPDPARRLPVAGARSQLRPVLAERLPVPVRGLDGAPIEFFDHVGPTPAEWTPPGLAAPADCGADGPTRAVTAHDGPRVEPAPVSRFPRPTLVDHDLAERPGRKRRRWLWFALAAVVLMAGAATTFALVNADWEEKPPKVPTTETTAEEPPADDQVEVGGECDWTLEGQTATTADGVTVTCRRIGGEYVWQR